jgi:septum formation protein
MLRVRNGNDLILASSSPRRKELLENCGLSFRILKPDTDEEPCAGESPEAMVLRLALEKARCIARQNPDSWVIGADTTVTIGGVILGKPADSREAAAMLERIQGQTHEVWGGTAIVNERRGIAINESHVTRVKMATMDAATIKRYAGSGEPLDKAGAYAIQGAGVFLVEGIDGSYTNVVGLPVSAIIRSLQKLEVIELQ